MAHACCRCGKIPEQMWVASHVASEHALAHALTRWIVRYGAAQLRGQWAIGGVCGRGSAREGVGRGRYEMPSDHRGETRRRTQPWCAIEPHAPGWAAADSSRLQRSATQDKHERCSAKRTARASLGGRAGSVNDVSRALWALPGGLNTTSSAASSSVGAERQTEMHDIGPKPTSRIGATHHSVRRCTRATQRVL